MNRNTAFNVVLFALLSAVVLGGWWAVETYLIPKPPPPTPPEVKPPKPGREAILAVTGGAVSGADELKDWASRFRPEVPKPEKPPEKPPEETTPPRLIALGGAGYNLRVLLTNRGAGVQQVVLPAFDQTSREGKTAKDADGKPYPLELIPGYHRPLDKSTVRADGEHQPLKAGVVGKDVPLSEPSYTLLHYDGESATHPSRKLLDATWAVAKEGEGEVAFETTLGEPYFLKITKTFTLDKTDFHVRMKLKFEATADRTDKSPDFHYQIAGPRSIPIEGEWYAGTLRNAVVGWLKPNGGAGRDIQDAAHVVTEHGGYEVKPGGNTLTFAAVVNQFFASAVCVDPDTDWVSADDRKKLWKYVRATREWQSHPLDLNESPDGRKAYYDDKPQLGDITVRVRAEPIKPAAGKPVVHSYWLYHGPTKVRLLNSLHLLDKDHQGYTVTDGLPDRYSGELGLNALTDAPSPNWFGSFAAFIRWTDLVVWFTNRMHDILGWMHGVVGVWGVNILMLTVMVRLILLVPSRRQQAGMMKMQEKMAAMKPELDKLAEKYKGDPQRLNQEKTRLMLQHGVNPLSSMGGCLLMFAQMPVFLGLYYCLQESIFFRLDNFLWMPNLAAPDMLVSWSESIPFVSTADQVGHSWYLGPFVNILPVVAVALMYLNFKISSPPPTDEQQEMQQKTMKFMMLFMGVFFYKMAAGLCLYFICSTTWGLIERKLLKKKKADADPLLIPGGGPSANGTAAKPAAPPKPAGFLGRLKEGLLEKLEEAQRQAESKGQQIINNPQQKPGQKPPPDANGPGGKGKRKRRK